MPEIAWGKKVSPQFKSKVTKISSNLGCDPSFLMAAMAFETGETFSPSKKNPKSSATGLIQFMAATAKNLGTTTAALASMTAEKQLDFVEKYMSPFKGRLNTLSDVYMAILRPSSVGKPEASVLFKKPTKAYNDNKGLDTNKDGIITKSEATSKVFKKLTKGMHNSLRG